jgi:hypothetical protein
MSHTRLSDGDEIQFRLYDPSEKNRYINVLRCAVCHKIDRADFFMGRMAALGYACRHCKISQSFYDNGVLTPDERLFIAKGGLRDPDY